MADAPVLEGLAPFSLRDAPALIERVFPAQKIGVEAQKERKAGAGQTLTALGSHWKAANRSCWCAPAYLPVYYRPLTTRRQTLRCSTL